MYSNYVYRLLIPVVFLLLTSYGASAKGGKCVYWFGTCTSCEAPLTCKNSRLSKEQPQSSPQPGSPPRRAPAVASSVTRIAPLPSRPGRASGLYEEYQQFKAFMKRSGGLDQVANDAELQRLFFNYRRWLNDQAGGAKHQ